MRYIVTGHKGFLGSRLTEALEAHGHIWHGLDSQDAGPDLAQRDVFRRALLSAMIEGPVDAVIHLAAQPGRVFGEESPGRTMRLNTYMTYEVAAACGEFDVRLVYVSTSEVYGESLDTPLPASANELTTPYPINIYGLTKLWGEQVAQLYAPERLMILRPTMPYGPDMLVGRGRAALPTFLWNAINGQPITVHADAKRSWCYIDDLIEAFVIALERGVGDIYNIGRDDDLRSMTDIATLACEIAGAPTSLIEYVDADDTISSVKNISTSRIRALGFMPAIDLPEGMERVFSSLLDRKAVSA